MQPSMTFYQIELDLSPDQLWIQLRQLYSNFRTEVVTYFIEIAGHCLQVYVLKI